MGVFNLGLQLMLYGLIGTFTVLFLFYAVLKIIMKVFPYKEDK